MSDAAGLKYAEGFVQICEDLHRQEHGQPTLNRIVELAVETIEACDFCGISLRGPGREVTTPAATGPIVEQADALQYQLGEGPCLDAIWKLDTYVIEDVATETRWPAWASAASELGIGSVLSVRLDTADDQVLGGINLYARAANAFDNTDVAMASIFARHAAAALSGAHENDGLRTALRTRQAIGVAQGILMQRYRLSLDESFEVLRRYSQTHNMKVRVLAENLVRAGGVPEDEGSLASGGGLEKSFGIGGHRLHSAETVQNQPA